jgi:voltage-gated potassium channel
MQKEERITAFQFVLVALSIYVLIALLIERTTPISPNTERILIWSDTAICIIFLFDLFVRFFKAPNKLQFLKWGWIDFISSIPMLGYFRIGRLVRVARVLRVLRGIRSAKVILRFLFVSRIKGALASALFASMVLLIFSCISIMHLETEPNSTIRTPYDALWWSLSELTTTSFTDKAPVTEEGRMLGVLLVFGGMCLFAVFTACFASWFLQKEEKEEHTTLINMTAQLAALTEEVKMLRSQISGAKEHSIMLGKTPADL